MIDYNSLYISFIIFCIVFFLLWILPGILLWKLRFERKVYWINLIASLLFLFFMYRLIGNRPHNTILDPTVLDDFGELIGSWLLWGVFLLAYSIFRRMFKWKR